MGKYEKLVQLVSSADPQPIGGNELVCFAHMDNSAFNTGFKYLNDAIDTMLTEVEGRVERGEGPLPANSPAHGLSLSAVLCALGLQGI